MHAHQRPVNAAAERLAARLDGPVDWIELGEILHPLWHEVHREVSLFILGIVRFGKKSAQFLRHPFRLTASIGIAIGIA